MSVRGLEGIPVNVVKRWEVPVDISCALEQVLERDPAEGFGMAVAVEAPQLLPEND